MENRSKLSKLLGTSRDPSEIQDWIFSLTPLGIAFVFFHFFVLSMNIPNKLEVMVMGTVAGIIGLQTYWVVRGWRKNHLTTVIWGLVSIAVILGGLFAFHNFIN